MLYSRKWRHVSSNESRWEKCPPVHPSILCYSVMPTIAADLLFNILKCCFFPSRISFILRVCCFGIDINESEHAGWASGKEWVAKINSELTFRPRCGQGGVVGGGCTKTSHFPSLQVFPTVAGFLFLAWQRLCQGLKYIWGGAGRRAISGPPIMTANQSILLSVE